MRRPIDGSVFMIDIHSHILYDLDDGPKTLEDTIAMIHTAREDGICAMIVTPHYNDEFKYETGQMVSRFNSVVEKLDQQKMKLYLGNECSLNENLLANLLNGRCKTLADSKYVLVEISCNLLLKMTKMMISDIIANGYIPIIAHCERLIETKDDMRRVAELKAMGCLLQINARTILKPGRRWFKRWIFLSIKHREISFVSSDAHDLIHRRPLLREAYSIVSRKLGIAIAEEVFRLNAQRVIDSAHKDICFDKLS